MYVCVYVCVYVYIEKHLTLCHLPKYLAEYKVVFAGKGIAWMTRVLAQLTEMSEESIGARPSHVSIRVTEENESERRTPTSSISRLPQKFLTCLDAQFRLDHESHCSFTTYYYIDTSSSLFVFNLIVCVSQLFAPLVDGIMQSQLSKLS